jgi:hypothetical protein
MKDRAKESRTAFDKCTQGTAGAFAAECLGGLDATSHFDEFLGGLTVCSIDEQAAELISLQEQAKSVEEASG